MRLETERLRPRPLTDGDTEALRPILQDAEVMYAWEHAFSDEEVRAWIAEIRPENLPSRGLAERLGMRPAGSFIKRYRGKDMEHIIYEINKTENLEEWT